MFCLFFTSYLGQHFFFFTLCNSWALCFFPSFLQPHVVTPAGHKIECRFFGLLLKQEAPSTILYSHWIHVIRQNDILCSCLFWCGLYSILFISQKLKKKRIEIAEVTKCCIQNTIIIHLNHENSGVLKESPLQCTQPLFNGFVLSSSQSNKLWCYQLQLQSLPGKGSCKMENLCFQIQSRLEEQTN